MGDSPSFFDVWIARGMTGIHSSKSPKTGAGTLPETFWNDDKVRARLAAANTWKWFACWHGVTSFTAKPLLDVRIRFRARGPGECFQVEPKLFAKNMWTNG